MRTPFVVALSLTAGALLGATAVHGVQAQARPKAYVVGEIDVTDPEGYAREFGPLARKALAEGPGYRALALGGKTTVIAGPPPKQRVIINVFDSVDDAVKAYSSPAFLKAKKIGDKYATFRTFVVEGR
jgi:uncharacterized protein (DUF1330 family)